MSGLSARAALGWAARDRVLGLLPVAFRNLLIWLDYFTRRKSQSHFYECRWIHFLNVREVPELYSWRQDYHEVVGSRIQVDFAGIGIGRVLERTLDNTRVAALAKAEEVFVARIYSASDTKYPRLLVARGEHDFLSASRFASEK